MKEYDYAVVGAGLFGSVFAHEMTRAGKKVVVFEKRSHIGGNCYSSKVDGIETHRYGPHIFHTNKKELWDYVNSFIPFRQFKLKVTSNVYNRLYSFPINLSTIHSLYPSVTTPEEARSLLAQEATVFNRPANLEEHILGQIGPRLYKTFIKEYTKKQWGRDPKHLPASIIKRIPVRITADDNYFFDEYQGMPESYTTLFQRLLEGINVHLNVDFLQHRGSIMDQADTLVYTGPIDEFFEYKYGALEYRSLRLEQERYEIEYFQGTPLVVYPTEKPSFTRISEWKHFHPVDTQHTIITREFPEEYILGKNEPMYPIRDSKNTHRYNEYRELANSWSNLIIAGRLGNYLYADMAPTIQSALNLVKKELSHA